MSWLIVYLVTFCYNKQMRFIDVQKPSRYVGGEFGIPEKKEKASINCCMCFPDTYEVGMSNLGMRILYFLLNEQKGIHCDRCFAPFKDYIEFLKEKQQLLSGLESKMPLNKFDVIGFSLQYELCYTNMLYMLDNGGIPLLANERTEDMPIIIAGGPCTVNATPVHDFIDLVFVGEAEESILQFFELLKKEKGKLTRGEIIGKAHKIIGIYSPALLKKNQVIKRAFVKDINEAYFPNKAVVSNIELVHDRAVVELFRGCANGCRFCQAGFIYRPVREKSAKKVVQACCDLINFTGYDEISLNSLSTGDYSELVDLVKRLQPLIKEKKVQLSLPSLRLDSFDGDFIQSNRLSSLTFAPEAGTQRLRNVINKNITEEDIFSSIGDSFSRGLSTIKLYFMMGLPTETMEDIEGIVEIVSKIKQLYKEKKTSAKSLRINVSIATFIPKPHTPFQWEGFLSEEEFIKRRDYLRAIFKQKNISFSWNDYKTSLLEACLARGDEKIGEVLLRAYKNGAVFDGWSEHFNYQAYDEAFSKYNIEPNRYLKKKDIKEKLSWDFISVGVDKKYLENEITKAYKFQCTKSCYDGCNCCGLQTEGLCNVRN